MRAALLLALLAACTSKEAPPGPDRQAAKTAGKREAKQELRTPNAEGKNAIDKEPEGRTRGFASYQKALAEGRRLMKEGKASEALVALQSAAALRPLSAMVYSEISWLAFTQENYSLARSAAETSILHGKDQPIVQAMSYYNIGRAQEAEGDQTSAIENYVSSYKLRQNKVVAKRLSDLGQKVPESNWSAEPLAGPYETLADFCAPFGLVARSAVEEVGPPHPGFCETEIDEFKPSAAPPWLEQLGMHDYIVRSSEDDFIDNLSLRTDKGWFVRKRFGEHYNRSEWKLTKAEGVGTRLVIYHSFEEGRFEMDYMDYVTVCGIGKSGVPSCYGPVLLSERWDEEDGGERQLLNCSARFTEEDQLVISAKDKTCHSLPGFVGNHHVLFP